MVWNKDAVNFFSYSSVWINRWIIFIQRLGSVSMKTVHFNPHQHFFYDTCDEAKLRTDGASLSVLQAYYEVKVTFMLITYYFSGQDSSFPSSHIALQFLQTASRRASLSVCHSADGFRSNNNAFLWSLASVSANVRKHGSVNKDTVTMKYKRGLYLTQLAASPWTSWVSEQQLRTGTTVINVSMRRGALALVYLLL